MDLPELNLAFLILAHNDSTHLERLCRVLQPHAVFIHADGKAIGFPGEAIATLPGVTLVQPSVNVYWGDFSMIEATLRLITTARNSGSFTHYILLSGGCYPIKSIAKLKTAFAKDPTREWISLTSIKPHSELARMIGRHWRMTPLVNQKLIDEKLRAVWNKISKTIGRDIEREIHMPPYFGSQWWALTEDCVKMVLQFLNDHPEFTKAYRSVYAPDEHFFHTIIGNSPFGRSANYVEDCGSKTNQLTPLHLISETEKRIFGTVDGEFERIRTTKAFFIRKVSSTESADLLDRIDQELLLQTLPAL